MCQMGTSQPRSFFPCFWNPVPPVLGDLSCIPARPMSVSAAATALYKSLPWQPAAPRLSNLTSATRYTFPLTSFRPLRVQTLVAVPLLRECTQRQNPMLWFVKRWRVLVNIPFAWKDCLLHLARGEWRRPAAARLSNTTARRLFELARGSGPFRELQVDLKLCNQEWKWSVTRGVSHGSVGNYSGGTQLLLCLLSLPF